MLQYLISRLSRQHMQHRLSVMLVKMSFQVQDLIWTQIHVIQIHFSCFTVTVRKRTTSTKFLVIAVMSWFL